jgi:hypothetical protein
MYSYNHIEGRYCQQSPVNFPDVSYVFNLIQGMFGVEEKCVCQMTCNDHLFQK